MHTVWPYAPDNSSSAVGAGYSVDTFVRFLGGFYITDVMAAQRFEIIIDEFVVLYVTDTISK
jgi:hypothetical protein